MPQGAAFFFARRRANVLPYAAYSGYFAIFGNEGRGHGMRFAMASMCRTCPNPMLPMAAAYRQGTTMSTHENKTVTQTGEKSAAASLQQHATETGHTFADMRPEAVRQHKLQHAAQNSAQAQHMGQLQQVMQQKAATGTGTPQAAPNHTGLPDGLKAGIESLSGHSMNDVKVHYNSSQPAQLQAHAFAQGTQIHVAPGQERHLPHEAWHVVQQKQGRVKPTRQLMGKVPVNDDAGLEKEADRMGAKALTVQRSFAHTLPQTAHSAAPVVQRAMGMEIELGRGVASTGGKKLEGDAHIIEEGYFNLVTDSRGNISNMEFVMHHFDQHTGDEPAALAELNQRLDAMKALYDLIVGEPTGTKKLSEVAGAYHYAGAAIPSKDGTENTAPVDVKLLAPDVGAHELYVQYTVGVDLNKIHQATSDIKDDSYNPGLQKPKEHATDALRFATQLMAGTLNGIADANAVKGYLTLAYLQIAAFADAIQASIQLKKRKRDPFPTDEAINRSGGQVKNKTILLSRVTLQNAFSALDPAAQQELENNQDAILDAMAAEMENRGMSFAENAVRQVGNLQGISLINYAKSGLTQGGQNVSQQRVFGGMGETGVDNSVPGNRGIPMEVRSLNKNKLNWAEMVSNARTLLIYTRNLHT